MKMLLKNKYRGQGGFTILEILIATAICGLAGIGIMMVAQLFQQNRANINKVQAIAQVENVANWINIDAMMAKSATNTSPNFPLQLTWQGADGKNYQVIYSRAGNSLQRSYAINGGSPTISLVACNINFDTTKTNVSASTNGVVNFQVTSAVGSSSETRTYQVKLRVDQPSS